MFPILNPLPLPSPYHPSGSSQCTSPEHAVSCLEPGLVIHFTYDNIHVSMPFSQTIPPLPSPTESKRLFYTFVSLLLSCIQGITDILWEYLVILMKTACFNVRDLIPNAYHERHNSILTLISQRVCTLRTLGLITILGRGHLSLLPSCFFFNINLFILIVG